jgi:hypothetical protein
VISQSKLVTKSQRSTHHDSETWSIRGRRYVAISETDAEMVLDDAMVKNLASAPTIAMRGLYRDKESQMPVAWTIIIRRERVRRRGVLHPPHPRSYARWWTRATRLKLRCSSDIVACVSLAAPSMSRTHHWP